MFIVKDKMCEGTKWHERKVPQNPAVEPYFAIDQAALTISLDAGKVQVAIKTTTPNFKEFQSSVDHGPWQKCDAKSSWNVHPGSNHLAVKVINKFGVEGPVSTAVIEVSK